MENKAVISTLGHYTKVGTVKIEYYLHSIFLNSELYRFISEHLILYNNLFDEFVRSDGSGRGHHWEAWLRVRVLIVKCRRFKVHSWVPFMLWGVPHIMRMSIMTGELREGTFSWTERCFLIVSIGG